MYKLLHRTRCALQYINQPILGIAGGYHYGNLGDMALGASIQALAKNVGISSGLQTIYNLNRWPKTERLIVGGGALIDSRTLDIIFKQYKNPETVAICGVDIEDYEALHTHRKSLLKTAYLSTRSEFQAQQVNEILGMEKAMFQPDIAFCLPVPKRAKSIEHPIAILNVCSRFVSRDPTITRDQNVTGNPNLETLSLSYDSLFVQSASKLSSVGFDVIHVPFTPDDDRFARNLFKSSPVKCLQYTANPFKVLGLFQNASFAIPSRYHSLVFSLIVNCPVLPFAYADKSVRLLNELGINKRCYLDINDLAEIHPLKKQLESLPLTIPAVSDEVVRNQKAGAKSAIQTALRALNLYK